VASVPIYILLMFVDLKVSIKPVSTSQVDWSSCEVCIWVLNHVVFCQSRRQCDHTFTLNL
jgi:hypothetical protein